MAQASSRLTNLSIALTPDPQDPRFGWLMLWSLSPTGECCCSTGSSHRLARGYFATGAARDCGNGVGKHPWWIQQPDGTINGYRHGCLDADPSQAVAVEKWGKCEGARRWGVTLSDTVVIDLDGPESLLAFYRLGRHLPTEKILGIAKTPRGWHIYVDCPGWNQRALNRQMKAWLGDWDGTDASKISRRGLLMDVRTGPNRYVIWPAVDRRWATAGELVAEAAWAGRGMPAHRMITSGDAAPWNLTMTAELAAKIGKIELEEPKHDVIRTSDGSISRTFAMRELDRWCLKLRGMPPNSGRNNTLNQIAYYAGARAICAGMTEEFVRDRLQRAASQAGLNAGETNLTIDSGLRSGLEKLTAKVS